jgi:hypothetical protein
MNKNNFNEFYWEQELKKEDAKMHFCMQEIPDLIDLPDEYELLFSKVKKKPEFSSNLPNFFEDEEFFDDFIENELYILPDEWKNSKWYDAYLEIENLLESWRVFTIESDLEADGICILTFYAMLCRMTINLINLSEDGQAELQKAVAKRILCIISRIASALQSDKLKCVKIARNHLSRLLALRDKIINIRFSLEKK